MSRLRKLSNEQMAEIRSLRHDDRRRWSFNALAKKFDVSDMTIKRVADPEYAHKTERLLPAGTCHRGFRDRVEADALKLAREIPKDSRDTTGVLCGDPIPGDPRRVFHKRS